MTETFEEKVVEVQAEEKREVKSAEPKPVEIKSEKPKMTHSGTRVSGTRKSYKGLYQLYRFGNFVLRVYEPHFGKEVITLSSEIYNKVKKEN